MVFPILVVFGIGIVTGLHVEDDKTENQKTVEKTISTK